ncbi:MAG: hypothetical protein R3220_10095 [Balneolaceae bacterium]|nr:hypothetical protein [Balneolaceae bacterium]
MIEVIWNTKKYSFPEGWDEMNKKQFLSVTRNLGSLLFKEEVTEEHLYARRIIALQEIMNISLHRFKKVYSHELVDLIKLLDFTKKIDINKQLIPVINIKHGLSYTRLFGPETGLKSSTFDEFIMADTYFVNISAKSDFDFAYFLFAVLYRPVRKGLKEFKSSAEWNGDVREPFNLTRCKERVELLKKYLKHEYLIAVLYFYWGFREKNVLIYKTIFPEPKTDEEGKVKRKKNSYGWADTRLELSGNKFGNYSETGKANWRNIIFDMHRNEQKRQEREKQIAIEKLRAKSRK